MNVLMSIKRKIATNFRKDIKATLRLKECENRLFKFKSYVFQLLAEYPWLSY